MTNRSCFALLKVQPGREVHRRGSQEGRPRRPRSREKKVLQEGPRLARGSRDFILESKGLQLLKIKSLEPGLDQPVMFCIIGGPGRKSIEGVCQEGRPRWPGSQKNWRSRRAPGPPKARFLKAVSGNLGSPLVSFGIRCKAHKNWKKSLLGPFFSTARPPAGFLSI